MKPSIVAAVLLVGMLVSCKVNEKNITLHVKKDGSADLALLMVRIDEKGHSMPCSKGEEFGIAGATDFSHVPLILDVAKGNVADIAKLRIHDITFSKDVTMSAVKITVQIPVGPDAVWMKKMPLIKNSVSEHVLNELKKFEKSDEDEEAPLAHDEKPEGWLFVLKMPGDVSNTEVKAAGGATRSICKAEDNRAAWGDREDAYLTVKADACNIKENGTITWVVESRVKSD